MRPHLAINSLLLALIFSACSEDTPTQVRIPTSTANLNAFNIITEQTFADSTCKNLNLELPVGIFASPTGKEDASGTQSDPLDLASALGTDSPIQEGETLWLLEGTYQGNFLSELRGTSALPIKVKPYPGKQVRIDSNIPDGGSGLWVKGAWTEYYDLEIYSSSTTHNSSETGSNPSDLNTNSGVTVNGANTKVINFIVHDNVGSGMNTWSDAPNSELYGNIIYNNGWSGPDRGHGHAIYAQNREGYKNLKGNIIFFGYGTGIHVYTQNGQMNGFDVQNNTWFMTGASNKSLGQNKDNCLIGGFQPVKDLTLKNNLGFSMNSRGTRLGYGGSVEDQDALLSDNYLNENLWITGTWSSMSIHNTEVNRGLTGSAEDYISSGVNGNVVKNSPPEQGLKVFIKANTYDPRRADITIFNHNNTPDVEVDLSSVLKIGEAYRIHSSFALFKDPIIKGVYDGENISLPMGSVKPPQPTGTSDVTDQEDPKRVFGVFILTHGGCL